MKAYHETRPDALADALVNGLERTSHGDKSDDQAIIHTDRFLDAHCPQHLKEQCVSRDGNLYGYVWTGDKVIDITDGAYVPVDEFISMRRGCVLELTIDPEKCFVSDLDAYDVLKSALAHHESQHICDGLAKSYWSKLVKFSAFNQTLIRRPEVMITYDVPPSKIKSP